MKQALMLGLTGWMGLTGLVGTAAMAQAPTIELTHAREVDLDGLRGLGPTSTRQILEERDKRPFRDWQDLMQRSTGIGPKKAAQLSAQGLRVQGQPYPAPGPIPATAPQR